MSKTIELETAPTDQQAISRETGSTSTVGQFRGQRLTDLFLATVFTALFSPVLIVRALLALITHRRILALAEPEKNVPARFAGEYFAAGTAGVFSVFNGQFTIASNNDDNPVQGSLFSENKLRRSIGVDYLAKSDNVTSKNQGSWNLNRYLSIILRSLLAKAVSPVKDLDHSKELFLFGIKITNSTMSETVNWIKTHLDNKRQVTVGFVNADCLNKAYDDKSYHHTLRQMDRIYPDGIGVRLASQLFNKGLADNLNGTDLFPEICQSIQGTSHSVFLLGAKPGVADAVATNMCEKFPGLNIAGVHDGYFEDNDKVIDMINASGASIVFVAMGAPKQELWINENRDRLKATVLLGVGGLFDFYSGQISRAPQWLREMGLEWTWRLLQEPGRMWRRYLIGNFVFMYRTWRQKRRNGAVSRPLHVTPSEESDVLAHYGKLDRNNAARVFVIRLKRVIWGIIKTSGAAIKRAIDFTAALLLLILLFPLFLFVALVIRIESKGPVFYSQTRVGYRGQTFLLWKFRSMYVDADKRREELEAENEMAGGVIFKMKRDPRITRTGRVIRRLSIDELPQLWNVLRGNMSLVGPRPALPSEVEMYSVEERVRLLTKPGLTCIWQVSGRSDIPFPEQVLLDEDYLYSQSLRTDIKLLLKTIPAVITGKGAY